MALRTHQHLVVAGSLPGAINVELKLTALVSTTKNGTKLTFEIDSRDAREFLGRVGARFGVALVEIGDDEKPVEKIPTLGKPPQTEEFETPPRVDRRVQMAGILCNEPLFQRYLRELWCENDTAWNVLGETNKARAATLLRAICEHIDSRKELATNAMAAKNFDQLTGQFEGWKKGLR